MNEPIKKPKTRGQKLLDLRLAKNWSQDELAAKSGMSRQYISMLEGDQREGKIPALRRLATALGVTLESIL